MIFDVLTIFPGLFSSFLAESLLAKALAKGLLTVNLIDIRDFTNDTHRTVDDRPYGGGPGMVMKPEPLTLALESILKSSEPRPKTICLSPSGPTLNQKMVRQLASLPRIILICGRYEGIDQRFLDLFAIEELSIGDYVLNGGEVPAMALIESISRLIPGFLGKDESLIEESHSHGLLEHPHYTRPPEFRGLTVPQILLSGHHAQVAAYRLAEAMAKTRAIRPDLLARPELEEETVAALGREGAALANKTTPQKEDLRLVMKTVEFKGAIYSVDDEGFLLDSSLWDPNWVEMIRIQEDIDEITDDHQEIMRLLREYCQEKGLPPRVRDMTVVTGFKLKYIYELFPSGPGKGACKMAGLPKPEGCA
ncbi:MAG: tRNA (guanosine(37)-N1)-methyltransferase TrmD [Deltaproteobacteria bacterium]|jgi:tRNA (guanine37-N1)-methyltransferase|nr:tRNA (guanosine(37)-N1)-methyltransferase TrmD [Deltaproteobacteria bacterium]